MKARAGTRGQIELRSLGNGEGELLERRGAAVSGDLGRRHRLGQVLRHDEPSEAQAWCEGFACRPGVDDAVGRQALQCADRCPVVAVLGVVVVLDDDRAMLGGPVQHGRPVRGGQHRAGGPLVRGVFRWPGAVQRARREKRWGAVSFRPARTGRSVRFHRAARKMTDSPTEPHRHRQAAVYRRPPRPIRLAAAAWCD